MAEENAAAPEAPGASAAEDPATRAAISEEEVSALLEKNSADVARPFDLSSRRISRSQLPMLEFICRGFAQRVGATLSGLLSREVGMQFDNLQSDKMADVQASIPLPASIGVIRIKPLPGFALICFEPALLLVLLDAFFGGSGRATSDSQAAAAPAAQRFLGLMIRNFAADLTAAWAPVAAVELELVKQETHPRFVQIADAQEVLIVAKFSVNFAGTTGRIDLVLPERLLAPVREALASEGGKPAVRTQANWTPALAALLQHADLETRAILVETQISLGELVRLVPGDVIPIEAPQEVTLLAGDVPLYRGKFGISQGRNAVKILTRGSA